MTYLLLLIDSIGSCCKSRADPYRWYRYKLAIRRGSGERYGRGKQYILLESQHHLAYIPSFRQWTGKRLLWGSCRWRLRHVRTVWAPVSPAIIRSVGIYSGSVGSEVQAPGVLHFVRRICRPWGRLEYNSLESNGFIARSSWHRKNGKIHMDWTALLNWTCAQGVMYFIRIILWRLLPVHFSLRTLYYWFICERRFVKHSLRRLIISHFRDRKPS